MLILHEIRISSQILVGVGHELILLSLSLILLRLKLLGRIIKDALILLLLHVVKVTYDIPLIVAIKLIIICKHLLLYKLRLAVINILFGVKNITF